jgi:pilus assembly protein CpaE
MATIYIIDDDEQMLDLIGVMVRRAGHTPTLIAQPKKGLDLIKSEPPDLVILDVMMPGTSGHDVAREIRANSRLEKLPILVLTARSQEIDKKAALEAGADAYLSKPVTSRALADKIDELLSSRKVTETSHYEYAGFVIALFGLRGGIGRTTIAVNLAAALRQQDHAVCLVDLSPASGQVAHHLRLQPGDSWVDLPHAGDSPTWEAIQPVLQAHSSGLQVLAAPAAPQSPLKPTGEDVLGWLKALRQSMDFVVVDLPAVLNPAVAAAVASAGMIIHLVTPDYISVKAAAQGYAALEQANLLRGNHVYILNQVAPEGHVEVGVIERGLKSRLAFKLGYDPQQGRALTHGIPLTLADPATPLAQSATRVAEAISQRVTVA